MAAEIRDTEKNLTKLEKRRQFKKHHFYDDEYKKIRRARRLFKYPNRDYYKPIKTDDSFDNKNNYIEYISKGDKYENLSTKEYLDMIRPYLKNMIDDHKTPVKLPYNKITFGEWKIKLTMLKKCVSNRNFEETCNIYSVSDNIEIMMGGETDDIIDELLKSLLQRFQDAKENSNERGSRFVHENVELLYYYLHKISMKRGN